MKEIMVNVSDLPHPDDQSLTVKEYNLKHLHHKIPLGTLVEVDTCWGDGEGKGLRLYVVGHGRDCDKTPLYHLSYYTCAAYQERMEMLAALLGTRKAAELFSPSLINYGEGSLKVIRLPEE